MQMDQFVIAEVARLQDANSYVVRIVANPTATKVCFLNCLWITAQELSALVQRLQSQPATHRPDRRQARNTPALHILLQFASI